MSILIESDYTFFHEKGDIWRQNEAQIKKKQIMTLFWGGPNRTHLYTDFHFQSKKGSVFSQMYKVTAIH